MGISIAVVVVVAAAAAAAAVVGNTQQRGLLLDERGEREQLAKESESGSILKATLVLGCVSVCMCVRVSATSEEEKKRREKKTLACLCGVLCVLSVRESRVVVLSVSFYHLAR